MSALKTVACLLTLIAIVRLLPWPDIATAYTKTTPRKLAFQSAGSVSQDSWDLFYKRFAEAVRKRDRAVLKDMMSVEFTYTFGPTPDGDPRDNAFKDWNDPKENGWSNLDKVLVKGVVVYKRNYKPLTRVAPPAARSEKYLGWRAFFELGDDGKWRWTSFVAGD